MYMTAKHSLDPVLVGTKQFSKRPYKKYAISILDPPTSFSIFGNLKKFILPGHILGLSLVNFEYPRMN